MRKAVLMVVLCVVIFAGVYARVIDPTSDKLVLLIHDGKENHVRHITLIDELFEELGYESIEIYSLDHVRAFQADRIIVVYSGHGANQETVRLYLSDGNIELDDILHNLDANEMILMTESCFGGYWLSYGQENSIIITAVQGTYAHELYYQYSPYGIAGALPNLIALAYLEDLPLERAYEVWRDQIIVPNWHTQPGIYDGIEGEVWL